MLIVMLSLCRGGRSCSLYASMLYLACSAEVYVNTRLTICWSSPVRRSRHRVRDYGEYDAVTLQAEVMSNCTGAENGHVTGGDGTWWDVIVRYSICSVPSSIYRKTERMRWCHEATLHLHICIDIAPVGTMATLSTVDGCAEDEFVWFHWLWPGTILI